MQRATAIKFLQQTHQTSIRFFFLDVAILCHSFRRIYTSQIQIFTSQQKMFLNVELKLGHKMYISVRYFAPKSISTMQEGLRDARKPQTEQVIFSKEMNYVFIKQRLLRDIFVLRVKVEHLGYNSSQSVRHYDRFLDIAENFGNKRLKIYFLRFQVFLGNGLFVLGIFFIEMNRATGFGDASQ